MSKFHVRVTNTVKYGKFKPGEDVEEFRSRKKFEEYKFVSMLFMPYGTTEENF